MLAESYLRSGKVRDLYRLNDGRVVLVASDRISAFDVVLPSTIPDKGRVLTGLSRFWFAETATMLPNHLLSGDVDELYATIGAEVEAVGGDPADLGSRDDLRGRIMLCRPAAVVPIEAVVRGYLSGSGWKEYQATGTVCGIPLPSGLRESDRLPEPIFTPATKAEQGHHDENVSFDRMIDHIAGIDGLGDLDDEGRSIIRANAAAVAEVIRDRSIALYRYGAAVAARRGIILADTKFEFGTPVTLDGRDRRVGLLVRGRWTVPGRPAHAHRRGHDPRLVAVLGRRHVRAGSPPGELRQAIRPRLARGAAVGQDGARAGPARRCGRRDPRPLRRSVRADHGRQLRTLPPGGCHRPMSTHRFAVNVLPKPGILDPQGRAVEGSLGHLGITGVSAVRVGRRVELTVEATDAAAAEAVVVRLASELLSNPLIEAYTIEPLAGASSLVGTRVD